MGGQARGVGVSGLPLPPPLHRCPPYLHPHPPSHSPPPQVPPISLCPPPPPRFMLASASYTKGSHSPSTREKVGDPLHGTAHPAAPPGGPAEGAPWCPPRKPSLHSQTPGPLGRGDKGRYTPASQPQQGVQPGPSCRHPDLTRTPVGLMPTLLPPLGGWQGPCWSHSGSCPDPHLPLDNFRPPWGHSKARGQGCQESSSRAEGARHWDGSRACV